MDRAWIARHIPHQGSMCLLDEVLDWSETAVRCLVRAHRSRHNPLRAHGRLGAVCGIEFAAQAVALHGALLDPNAGHLQRGGYLVALREVEVHVDRLDDIGDDLLVSAVRLVGDETTVLYQFRLGVSDRILLTGRATIVIDPRRRRSLTPGTRQ